MKKKSGLGKNLNALLGGQEPRIVNDGDMDVKAEKVLRQLPVDNIKPGVYQPRTDMDEAALNELAISIREHGIIQPIVVRPISNADADFEIIAGERRWRAAQLAELKEVPVIIKDIPNQAALAIALIENIQRESLNPLEEARAFKRLIDEFKLTHQEVSEAVGKSRATITNILRLMNLDKVVQEMLERGDIELGHAKLLLALQGQAQIEVARKVVSDGLTVRATDELIKKMQSISAGTAEKQASESAKKALDPDVQYYQERLSSRLKGAVTFKHKANGKGKVVIEYAKLSELDALLDKIES